MRRLYATETAHGAGETAHGLYNAGESEGPKAAWEMAGSFRKSIGGGDDYGESEGPKAAWEMTGSFRKSIGGGDDYGESEGPKAAWEMAGSFRKSIGGGDDYGESEGPKAAWEMAGSFRKSIGGGDDYGESEGPKAAWEMAGSFRKSIGGGDDYGESEGPKAAWEIDLSKLEIGRAVAHGTHGTLFRGKYEDQDVAVKLLDDSLKEQLKELAAVWHGFNHSNITKFIGASMDTTNARTALPDRAAACCVVVEYLAGGTLKQHLINHYKKKLAYKEVVRLALSLARGMSFLHSKKIVHRNIKTEKMLLDSHMSLKIADFGVARVEAQDPKDMTGTTGTLGYMAPEVLTGEPYNRKCDVYSFGICLWEIYCCDMPYPDLSFVDISSAVVNKDLRPDIPRCCPSAMASIMRRCWDADPDVRPEMDEVVRLLEALDTSKGGGMAPEVKPAGAAGCFSFFRRRPRGAW
ncbi:hypothetical protein GUJ93_ZPchr0012g19887 [Zizania palustris]|uniref:Protein kinase domain-containing protein n=1 Tax=Zizania palustris TaxID=103762 RepID=A0A8J6BU18_ZIZPA|nr:hypothetical protein GUJ93_ZPchr0012g18864 [Zizania palustris]KAG8092936.1 hypothetical protein GUJ93_ZPchr0012g19345 [Zizania palustris]KAG8092937.1 hypothetical protein GUJ93_ZPchr0012g19887 [Zizania palustris]